MSTAPADAREALDMVRAGLGYLAAAAADPARLPAVIQAGCLRELEQDAAVLTAARAGFLAAFTAGQGHAGDGDYGAVSWLMHRTGITRGAAVGHTAWSKRVASHPRVLAALAAGQVPESAGRLICLWTGKLPLEYRDAADEQLLAAFAGGLGLADLAGLLRDRHCQWAGGCTQPAGACQVHHTTHKAHGGTTSVKDCVLLCPFHHQIVIHRWGWTLVVNPDGTTTAWNKNKTKVLHSHGPPARAG